jgi:hypothetical protein
VRKHLAIEELGDLLELPLLAVLATYRRGVELRAEARLVTTGVEEATRRIASRYLGSEAGAAYAAEGPDDLILRLEPGNVRAWDFADVM